MSSRVEEARTLANDLEVIGWDLAASFVRDLADTLEETIRISNAYQAANADIAQAGKAQLEATQEALAIAIKENGRIVAAIKAIHHPCPCDPTSDHCIECENFYWPCRTIKALEPK